jgi:hypothetical protein
LQRTCQLRRDRVLHVEDADDIGFELVRPSLRADARVDQLRRHAHPARIAMDAAFQQVSDAEFGTDRDRVLSLGLEPKR